MSVNQSSPSHTQCSAFTEAHTHTQTHLQLDELVVLQALHNLGEAFLPVVPLSSSGYSTQKLVQPKRETNCQENSAQITHSFQTYSTHCSHSSRLSALTELKCIYLQKLKTIQEASDINVYKINVEMRKKGD